MKSLRSLCLAILLFGLAAPRLAAQTSGCGQSPPSDGNKTLSSGKTYYLDVPSGYNQNVPMPVLFGFHGTDTGGFPVTVDGEFFCGDPVFGYLYGAFRDSDSVGNDAILVCPNSPASSGSFTDWSLSDFDDVLDDVQGDLCVDTDRIFATGHSAGASFVNQLGCSRGDILRGIAPVAPPFTPSCSSPVGQVAVIVMVGDDDQSFIKTNSASTRDLFGGINGCTTNSTTTPDPTGCARDSNDTHYRFPGCDSGYPVEYCQWDGIDHFEPWEFSGFFPGEDLAGPAIWAFLENLGDPPSGPSADLEISKTDNSTFTSPGATVTYDIDVINMGPSAVTDAAVSDPFPGGLESCSWTVSQSGGASGHSGGSGSAISQTLSMPSGSSVQYTVTCTVSAGTTGTLSNTATVSSATVTDPDGSDNSATDNNTLVGGDLGDAPSSFPTLLASNGAFHAIDPTLYLGGGVDAESDGQPNSASTGDDNSGDDEDGVSFTSALSVAPTDTTATVSVTASAAGTLNAWVDFSGDSSWNDAGEQIFADVALSSGLNSLEFTVPSESDLDCTYARFRFSTDTGLSWTGSASDGEVEDYAVPIVPAATYTVINTSFNSTVTLLALDVLSAGMEGVTPDVIVQNGGDVTFHAENSVVLLNGFAVEDGGAFTAQLGSVPTATCP